MCWDEWHWNDYARFWIKGRGMCSPSQVAKHDFKALGNGDSKHNPTQFPMSVNSYQLPVVLPTRVSLFCSVVGWGTTKLRNVNELKCVEFVHLVFFLLLSYQALPTSLCVISPTGPNTVQNRPGTFQATLIQISALIWSMPLPPWIQIRLHLMNGMMKTDSSLSFERLRKGW